MHAEKPPRARQGARAHQASDVGDLEGQSRTPGPGADGALAREQLAALALEAGGVGDLERSRARGGLGAHGAPASLQLRAGEGNRRAQKRGHLL